MAKRRFSQDLDEGAHEVFEAVKPTPMGGTLILALLVILGLCLLTLVMK